MRHIAGSVFNKINPNNYLKLIIQNDAIILYEQRRFSLPTMRLYYYIRGCLGIKRNNFFSNHKGVCYFTFFYSGVRYDAMRIVKRICTLLSATHSSVMCLQQSPVPATGGCLNPAVFSLFFRSNFL